MTTPKQALELRPCPFCGATPHRGLGKVYHDQLHGESHQDVSIWCPKGHAKITGVNAALAADEWNTRATASLQGEDAVERVARAVVAWADVEELEFTIRQIDSLVRTILATGLVADEAAKGRVDTIVSECGLEGAAAGWLPCSGCYETEDGRPVGKYPYSELFKCETGSGCHECGGLGVVWEYHSADDLAFLEQQLSEPEPLDEPAIRADERDKCAQFHDAEAARAKAIYAEMDRYSDDREERDGWRAHKDKEDRHRFYAAAIRSGGAK